ncbi:MAG: VCBS repeat-containing protein [Candidatus Aegiribacteria sp.]|nr:VCBS repeat-containing protein [Candidatus Aegiribacteria sp.]
MSSPLLADNSEGSMDIFIAMGDHGLGGWTGRGHILNGFPVSSDRGVSKKPAAFYSPITGNVVVYADNAGYVHMVDHNGIEQPGWPVFAGPGIITGISVVDLNDDSCPEITFGSADSRIHLLDIYGSPLRGWPVQLPAKLHWQPSQVSLGGDSGYGLVCALVTTRIYVLSCEGSILPGWPINTGYTSSSTPVTADIDADGLADIVFATYNNRLYVVSSSGSRIEGWPFFLDNRSSRGAVAIGHLDPDIRGLQLAVSCVDSSVTLINGSGRIAGKWRWPNFTRGLPTSPIITRTSDGLGVIVGADNGYIYAWNADGNTIEGYPIDFGQPISKIPAAGDINGDGNQELVVLGRSGRLGAYTISTISATTSSWPQMLCDESNSGSYGISYLPVARTGHISSEASGGIVLPYEISGRNVSDISLAYSTNAGYSWNETGSFRDNGSNIIWFSDEDLSGQDLGQCALKVTPYCPDGPGVSGLSNIFHVDNNIPPILHLITSEEESDGCYLLQYAVEDPESDIIQLQAQYSIDCQETWNNAHLTGSTFQIPPWFYGEPFRWNAINDIGYGDSENLALRVRAADSDPGPWSVLGDLHLDSDRLLCGQIIAPDVEVSGRITLGVRLSDPKENPLNVQYEYSTDAGRTWRTATVLESSIPTASAYQYEIIWESDVDIPWFDGYQVKFRVVPSDHDAGITVPSSPFHVDNNSLPAVSITSPGSWEHFDGSVPISFRISDSEEDEISLLLQYKLEGSSTWISASGLNANEAVLSSSYTSTVTWNSSEDLPGIDPMELRIRLGAFDADTVFSEAAGPLSIDNSRIPSVMQAAVSNVSMGNSTVTISYELTDPRNRTLDLHVTFSIDSGETWHEATVTGDIFGRSSSNYEGALIWHYDMDLNDRPTQILLKITPVSGSILGGPKIMVIALR